jgi:hypothetical protein
MGAVLGAVVAGGVGGVGDECVLESYGGIDHLAIAVVSK